MARLHWTHQAVVVALPPADCAAEDCCFFPHGVAMAAPDADHHHRVNRLDGSLVALRLMLVLGTPRMVSSCCFYLPWCNNCLCFVQVVIGIVLSPLLGSRIVKIVEEDDGRCTV